MRGGKQVLTVFGEDDTLDQRVDHRILDADHVARAGRVGSLGRPEVTLLVARRLGLRQHAGDHVIVELADAVDVLRGVDDAQ